MGMGKTLVNPGEKVGNMLISCPCVPHVLSVQHNDSSTKILVISLVKFEFLS